MREALSYKGGRLMEMVVHECPGGSCWDMLAHRRAGCVSGAQHSRSGRKPADFTLPSTTGEQISLSQFQGKRMSHRVLWRGFRPV